MARPCPAHARYKGSLPPRVDCAPCRALYNSRHPLCLCGCGDRVKLGDRRPTAKYATEACAATMRSQEAADRKLVEAAGKLGESSFHIRGDEATLTGLADHYVRTEDDLIRVFKIDTTVWTIVEMSCKASQQMSVPRATRPSPDHKWSRPSTTPVITQLYHVSAKLRKVSVDVKTTDALYAALLADIRAEVKRGPVAHTPRPRRSSTATFYSSSRRSTCTWASTPGTTRRSRTTTSTRPRICSTRRSTTCSIAR
jgi:hypothetical protein